MLQAGGESGSKSWRAALHRGSNLHIHAGRDSDFIHFKGVCGREGSYFPVFSIILLGTRLFCILAIYLDTTVVMSP